MAMGLASFGQRKTQYTLFLSIIHVIGAAIGGAMTGVILGSIGTLLSLGQWRSLAILLVACFALWQGWTHRPATLGLKRQVPRSWGRTMAPTPRYLLWGMLLGSGIATLIPYSALLVLLTAQTTSGILVGILAGALFGATRAIMMLLPLITKPEWAATNQLPFLLPTLKANMQRLNVVCIVVGSVLMMIRW